MRRPDLLRNRFGQRYISPSDLVQYAQSLGFIHVDEPLLEFLERERLLVPACRLRLPEAIARRNWMAFPDHEPFHDPSLSVDVDPQEQAAAEDLVLCMSQLRAGHPARLPSFRPLDLVDERHVQFVDHRLAEHPFVPWEDFTVRVGRARREDGSFGPLYDGAAAVSTYYHYWQIFILAEVLTMGMTIIADLRDETVGRAIWSLKLDSIPADRLSAKIHLSGVHGLRDAAPHVAALDALAVFLDYRNMWLCEVTKDMSAPIVLEGDRLNRYRDLEDSCAYFALWWSGIDAEAVLALIQWQCQQWDEWERRGQQPFTDECRRSIEYAALLYRIVTGASWRDVVDKVDRATSSLRPALDVISPDWLHDQKEAAAGSLKRWIAPTMHGWAPIGCDVSDAEVDQMIGWVSNRELLRFFWPFAHLADLDGYEYEVSLAKQANAAEGLAATIEHMLDDIGQAAAHRSGSAWPSSSTLGPKVTSLWDGTLAHPHVQAGIQLGLTNTASGFQLQRQRIAALPGVGPDVEVARALLEMILIRNQSIHGNGGLTPFSRQELFGLIEVLLRGAVLSWKRARQLGWV